MLAEEAVELYMDYLKGNTRPNTVRSFKFSLYKFKDLFSDYDMHDITESDIIEFIFIISGDCSNSTKRSRISAIRAFYNFVIDTSGLDLVNPCVRPMVKKLFKSPRSSSPNLLDKELIDEIIFRTTNERDRVILELMGRSGMRVGEVLNMRISDIDFDSSTILITSPKSGRSGEKVYITKKIAAKLNTYISKLNKSGADKVFNVSYSTAYRMVKKSGMLVHSSLRPHDLRRHAATQASRGGIPLEIVSKVILRHADISTTQRYLGAIDPSEASRWVEHLNR